MKLHIELGLICVLAVTSLIYGHYSLLKISKSADKSSGKGLAIAGLIVGYLGLIMLPIIVITGHATPDNEAPMSNSATSKPDNAAPKPESAAPENFIIQRAKRTEALATCTAIEAAVNDFYNEYASLPQRDLADDPVVPLNTKTDLEILNVLLALPEAGTPAMNTKKIKFLNVREARNGKGGLTYTSSGNSVTGLYDPWGGPYYIMLDGNYDEEIKVKPAAATKETTLHGKKVVVWSNGADCVNGHGGQVDDDVKTW